MFGEYHNIRIAGIQAAVPKRMVDNRELAERTESKRIRKFVEYTGVLQRHICEKDQSASDLSTYAADKLLNNLKWDRNEIRVLVNITQSADLRTPSTAMIIQKRLGIGIDCLAFDVNLGCSAYPSGLQIVAALLQNTGGKGLLLVGDGDYREISEKPAMDSLLFGDGAAATAIGLAEGNDFYYTQNTDGSRFELLYCPWNGQVHMDGNAILLMGLNEAAQSISNLKEHYSINDNEIDYYVLHQAQKIIIDGILEQCNIDLKKSLKSYDRYGNTSSATIPVTLSENAELLRRQERVKVYLCGFGVGLTWNGAIIDVDTNNIYPLIETDQKYLDLPDL